MKRFIIYLVLMLNAIAVSAQGLVKGKVVDKRNSEPISFVNARVTQQGTDIFVLGAITDVDGNFVIQGLKNGKYTLTISFIGYINITRDFTISDKNQHITFPVLAISEDKHVLKGVTVTGQKSTIKLEVDRKSYDVSQLISNAGSSASEVLENIPSVQVDNEGNVSLRGNSSVEIWINGKASGLTSDNRAEILQQMPAESIDHIEIIDNPSAKFSAEGSAGIINIVLKKDRKPGYYGSVQAGVDTRGGANTSFNINYNNQLIDAYANIGYLHRVNTRKAESEQEYLQTNQYQRYNTSNDQNGNNIFGRAGITLHATKKDDFSISGMMMKGKHNNWSNTPYHYGTIGAAQDSYLMFRHAKSSADMNMMYGEFNYRHNFTDKHYLDFTVDFNRWKMDATVLNQDSTAFSNGTSATEYDYQYKPVFMNNRQWEVKLDYENPITESFKIQAGYNGNFSHENTPQESYVDDQNWDGSAKQEDKLFFNRFIYDMDMHAAYATATYNSGKFGIMAGLRGEYWRINTNSYTWEQEHDATKRDPAFKKDYFQLFPSVFMSYQITKNDQLQLNYTRRLRRPWGGQLNSFKDTRDATMISFGNPELTPEYSTSFSLNYLKTWLEHSLLVSAYYRPTTDVIQRINYQSSTDGKMYQTNMNVAKSQSSGFEMVLKNKLFRFLDLTTTANAYYYKLDGFCFDIDGQTVTGEENHNFTWNARIMASIILPYEIAIQTSGNYNARQVISQGYNKSNFTMDFGLRKAFLNRTFVLAINCRDLLNSRKWESYTSSDTFTRYQMNQRGGRRVNFTLTYNFGNMKQKKRQQKNMQQGQSEMDPSQQYGIGDE